MRRSRAGGRGAGTLGRPGMRSRRRLRRARRPRPPARAPAAGRGGGRGTPASQRPRRRGPRACGGTSRPGDARERVHPPPPDRPLFLQERAGCMGPGRALIPAVPDSALSAAVFGADRSRRALRVAGRAARPPGRRRSRRIPRRVSRPCPAGRARGGCPTPGGGGAPARRRPGGGRGTPRCGSRRSRPRPPACPRQRSARRWRRPPGRGRSPSPPA